MVNKGSQSRSRCSAEMSPCPHRERNPGPCRV